MLVPTSGAYTGRFFLAFNYHLQYNYSLIPFFFSWTLIRQVVLESKYLLPHRNTRAHRPDRSETILNQAKNETLATACKSKQENVLENSNEFGLAPYPEMLVLEMLVNWQSLRLLSQK